MFNRMAVEKYLINGFYCLFLAVLLGMPSLAAAAFIEQLAIDSRAVSMANNVTARPPGHMSIHYNPAGLSQLRDGSWWHQGITVPHLEKTATIRGNPDFAGWLAQERWDHHSDPIFAKHPAYGPEGREQYSADQLKVKGTNQSGRMYVPVYDKFINFSASPRTSLAYRKPGSRWTLATGMYTPFATGFNHGHPNDPHRFGGKRAVQQHLIYQSPTVSYQVTNNLSVGLGVGAGQTAMNGELLARSPSDLTALTRELGEATEGMAIPPFSYLWYDEPLYGGGLHPWEAASEARVRARNDFSPSFNLGLLYEPRSWFGFGMVYQSEIKADMNGTFVLDYSEEFQRMVHWYGQGPWGTRRSSAMLDMPTNPVPYQRGTFTTTILFPQRAQFGFRVSPIPRLHLMFDLKWAEWSVRERDAMYFDQDIQMLQIAKLQGHVDGNRTMASDRYFRDTWDWGVAMELNLLDWLDIHAGYEFRKTAVRNKHFDFTSTIPDLHNIGAGFSMHLKNGGRIDFGAAYIFRKGYEIPPEQSKNLNSTNYFDDKINMFAGQHITYDFELYLFSLGFVVPFEAYSAYQKGNAEKMRKRIRLLNPFTRSPVE